MFFDLFPCVSLDFSVTRCPCTNHVSFAMLYLRPYCNSNDNLVIPTLSDGICFLLLILFSHTCQKSDCPFCWACLVECCGLYCLAHQVASPSWSLCDHCLDPDDPGIQAAWATSWVWLWKKESLRRTTKTHGRVGVNANVHRKLWFT